MKTLIEQYLDNLCGRPDLADEVLARAPADSAAALKTAYFVARPYVNQVRTPTQRQRELLACLTPAEAQIVRVVDFGKKTIEEAARILKMPATTAAWRYRLAHQHLLTLA